MCWVGSILWAADLAQEPMTAAPGHVRRSKGEVGLVPKALLRALTVRSQYCFAGKWRHRAASIYCDVAWRLDDVGRGVDRACPDRIDYLPRRPGARETVPRHLASVADRKVPPLAELAVNATWE